MDRSTKNTKDIIDSNEKKESGTNYYSEDKNNENATKSLDINDISNKHISSNLIKINNLNNLNSISFDKPKTDLSYIDKRIEEYKTSFDKKIKEVNQINKIRIFEVLWTI